MADTPGTNASKMNGGATVVVEADSKTAASPIPFYQFEVYQPDGKSLADTKELGVTSSTIALRMPPQSLRISAPIRSDISIDVIGGITVGMGGMGLRRWTISGSHGVGLEPSLVTQASSGQYVMSGGFAARQAIVGLFEAWVKANEQRRQERKPPLRMLFAVRHGTLTEFQNEEWWIQPDSLPEDIRGQSRPRAWDWNLSFVALQRRNEQTGVSGWVDPILPPSTVQQTAEEQLDLAKKRAAEIERVAQLRRNAELLQKARDAKSLLQKIQDGINLGKRAIYRYQSTVSTVSGYIRSCARTVQDALLLVSRSSLIDQPAREAFYALREIQTTLGIAKMAVDSYKREYVASAVKPPTVTVQTGDTIQSIAARELGDASQWRNLAAMNGLTYPYVDFSGPGGTPDAAFLTGGRKVFGEGDALKLPNQDGNVVPVDPIGTDMPDAGTPHTLVGGVDNLRAALLRRLRTPIGYLPHHPTYGSTIPEYVGKPLTPALVLSLRAEVDRVLREDPRVISVQSIGVSVDGDAIYVEASATSSLGPVSLSGTVGGTVNPPPSTGNPA